MNGSDGKGPDPAPVSFALVQTSIRTVSYTYSKKAHPGMGTDSCRFGK